MKNAADPAPLRHALLSWYDRDRRDLPWRRTHDPYAIWVSEVMLQQTRAEVVALRFPAFLAEFPDVRSLAAASEEKVLSLWSGLGYYSRARNLRLGAAVVRDRHAGSFPREIPEAVAIPGVGRYTARAVLSIAYGLPEAVVDGNVRRVLSRLHRLEPPLDASPKHLAALAEWLLDAARPGDFNQAMMELGARICLPRGPRCAECPLTPGCGARKHGDPEAYPKPPARRAVIALDLTVALLRDDRHRLLLERGRWPLLPRLWLPPVLEDGNSDGSRAAVPKPSPRLTALLRQASLEDIGGFRHQITHHRLRFRVRSGRIASDSRRLPEGCRLADDETILSLGRSSVLAKALAVEASPTSAVRAGFSVFSGLTSA